VAFKKRRRDRQEKAESRWWQHWSGPFATGIDGYFQRERHEEFLLQSLQKRQPAITLIFNLCPPEL
jgi:UDP-N-acetyl-D-mannosaminuronic acid transferase (WecB/TagA/CpsF family)